MKKSLLDSTKMFEFDRNIDSCQLVFVMSIIIEYFLSSEVGVTQKRFHKHNVSDGKINTIFVEEQF